MREFTYGELKQGLICCTVYRSCDGCPFEIKEAQSTAGKGPCTYQLLSAAMNCINTMERDLADVRALAGRWEDAATAHELEVIRLHESLDRK